MAERRMFAKTIALSDAFLDMPMSARCLYFTLGMVADDDGFVNAPRSVMRQCGATVDDMKLLIEKKFVIVFESEVIVIKHWRINNYLRADRYTPTKYIEEKASLTIDDKDAYHKVEDASVLGIPSGIPAGIPSVGKERIDKDRIDKDRVGEERVEEMSTEKSTEKKTYGEFNNVFLTDYELERLIAEYPNTYKEKISTFSKKLANKGYRINNHLETILKWAKEDADRPSVAGGSSASVKANTYKSPSIPSSFSGMTQDDLVARFLAEEDD